MPPSYTAPPPPPAGGGAAPPAPPPPPQNPYQKAAVAAARFSALSTAGVVVYWAADPLGGLSWSPKRDASTGRVVSTSQLFNWHPVLMSLAFLVCAGEAVLAYRSARPLVLSLQARATAATQQHHQPPPPTRPERKAAHATAHAAALVLAILGSSAAWRSHSLADPPIPHLYSPHSWLGATAMTLFLAQALLGCYCYVAPGLKPPERRASFSPWHRLLGLCAFFTALAAIGTGLQEKATFAQAFGKADVRGNAVQTAALAELGVLASALAVGAAFYFSSSSDSNGGGGGVGGGAYGGLGGGREEEGLLPPRGSGDD